MSIPVQLDAFFVTNGSCSFYDPEYDNLTQHVSFNNPLPIVSAALTNTGNGGPCTVDVSFSAWGPLGPNYYFGSTLATFVPE